MRSDSVTAVGAPDAPAEAAGGGCLFCRIASGRDGEAVILKQNEELVCFRDIYPAAPHHYLVVPREHILDCNSLQKRHVQLVERMAALGEAVLREQGLTDLSDTRLGFHKPPFTSVNHLHLHVLAPGSQIPTHMEFKFIPGSHRFVTVSCLQQQLESSSRLEKCVSIQ